MPENYLKRRNFGGFAQPPIPTQFGGIYFGGSENYILFTGIYIGGCFDNQFSTK